MAIPSVITSQTGGRQFNAPNFTKYSHFVGGVKATHHALMNYSPILNNMSRLFMVRAPYAPLKAFAGHDSNLYSPDSLFIQFKHMCEYMNAGVSGFQDISLEAASTPIQGGYAGRKFQIPTVTKDETNQIVIRLYELEGMPVKTVVEGWMDMIGDRESGLSTYGGWISGGQDEKGFEKRLYRRSSETEDGIAFNEANHTCEFISVFHDRSGAMVNEATLIADAWPTSIQKAHLNTENTGAHDVVVYEITFNCITHRSPIINAIANDLLKQYRIVSNVLNFNPELGDAIYAENNYQQFNKSLGPVPVDSAGGTNVGNLPAYRPMNTPTTIVSDEKDANLAKLAGQPNYKADPSYYGFGE